MTTPSDPENVTGYGDLHALALDAAVAGVTAIRAVTSEDAGDGRLAVADKGGVEDFVTAADLAAEKAITAVIRAARPDDEIVAEESGVSAGSSGIRWYVDPLDGTANLVAGRPDYAVSIAAHRRHEPVAVVVYRPADLRWLASSATGELRGNLRVRINDPERLCAARVSLSRPHDPARHAEAMRLREALTPLVATERRVGSAACALLEVVTGRLDAYVSVDIPPWDTAAGHGLVELAGGTVAVTHLGSGTPVSIAAGPRLAALLSAAVAG
ncbi:inositol monophosphatase family protein [Couchioplanes azureus]|uniref:inositol monophosphatase family protein n=1 Tax=Couchioplanes caeruleus TaxID=56438 RepID=UPI00166F7243|nr:inositol monophosphatase family protein [Couchioplanes caeruleus]GGQ82704.1 inositol monophosphatase [Couchioplanes caeruleus subsp. azureus]